MNISLFSIFAQNLLQILSSFQFDSDQSQHESVPPDAVATY
jgi:hypothetical protein